MDILNTKINNILTEKTLKVRPENIKSGVSVFGINGNYTGNLTDAEYSEANDDLDDILEGSTPATIYPPDWSEIGYSETPQDILDDFDYSKEIYDNWDSSVTDLSNKFYADTKLKYMPMVDTSNATNMMGFLSGCYNLSTVPLLNTNKVTIITSMFSSCNSLKTVPQFDTSNVKNFNNTFSGCTGLVDVPILNLSKATSLKNMFSSCLYLSNGALNNIMQMCIGATSYASTKTLKQIGLTSSQATTCQSLSNYQAFLNAGWTTGY